MQRSTRKGIEPLPLVMKRGVLINPLNALRSDSMQVKLHREVQSVIQSQLDHMQVKRIS
jgi:hypothetical protein